MTVITESGEPVEAPYVANYWRHHVTYREPFADLAAAAGFLLAGEDMCELSPDDAAVVRADGSVALTRDQLSSLTDAWDAGRLEEALAPTGTVLVEQTAIRGPA